ncbi:MAG: AAA family ATPase [Acidobacteriota bacterium]
MPYHARFIDGILRTWYAEPARKPLVLRGARQTGKTAAVRRFAETFDHSFELNLERFDDARLVRSCRSADELLVALAARDNLAQIPARTLLFLDEIQAHPDAIGWLRFFYEDRPQLAVIAAGSLLEMRLHDRGFSFPVGRVTFRALRPFSFDEFLRATARDVLADRLRDAIQTLRPLPRPLHDDALAQLRDYLLIGGMPEAVRTWATTGDVQRVHQVHRDLHLAFTEDFQRLVDRKHLQPLEAAFAHLPQHYGLRYRYENFAPGHASRSMKHALSRLEAAMLILQAQPTIDQRLPLAPRPRAAHKLIPLDIGLALHAMQVPLAAMRRTPLDRLLDGRVAEMYAGQALLSQQDAIPGQLFFWINATRSRAAEIDYLLPLHGRAVPIEVKAGRSGTLRSLHQYLHQADASVGVRLYAGELADDRLRVGLPDGSTLAYRLLSLPLYLAESVPLLPSAHLGDRPPPAPDPIDPLENLSGSR